MGSPHWLPLRRAVVVSRPWLWVNTLGPAIIGLWLSGSVWDTRIWPVLLWLSLPFNLLIYGVNDVSDMDVDAASARKGGFGGARIVATEVRPILSTVALLNAPFVAWFVATAPPAALGALAAYVVVFVLYSLPPVRLKARPFVDSLSNAAYALPLVFVPALLGAPGEPRVAWGLMSFAVAKHAFDALQDRDDDAAAGLRTTPVVLGIRWSLVWCALFWGLSAWLFAAASFAVALVVLVIAAGLLGSVALDPTPARARAAYGFSVAFPYVAGGVGGVLLALSLTGPSWWH